MSAIDWSERRAYVGASEVAPILGFPVSDSYASPYALWCDKTGLLPIVRTEEPWQRLGHALEPVILNLFAEDTGLEVEPGRTFRHPTWDFCGANPDGITADGEPVEAKNVRAFDSPKWGPSMEVATEETVPWAYLVQNQWQQFVMGARRGWLAALIGGNDFRWYPVPRDDDLIQLAFEGVWRFWHEHVSTRIPPDPDHTEATAEAIRRRFPEPVEREEPVPLNGTTDAHARAYLEAKADKAAAEKRQRAAKNHLKNALGDASLGATDTYLVDWRRGGDRARDHFNVKELQR